jgi:hypothetical protein
MSHRSRLVVTVIGIGIGFGLMLLAPVTRAQMHWRHSPIVAPTPTVTSTEPLTYGTTASVSHTLPSYLFVGDQPVSFPDLYDSNGNSRWCLTANCVLVTGLLLPAGAQVTSIAVDACDTNITKDFDVSLISINTHEGTRDTLVTATSAGVPGCVFFNASLPTPHTIDNFSKTYEVGFRDGATDDSVRFQAVRVFYTLQVSPAPATATFGDVPTPHPFFQFVEALVASGITAGCGGGNYCPDAPLTRGQMAVFLSKALGLHFAP